MIQRIFTQQAIRACGSQEVTITANESDQLTEHSGRVMSTRQLQ